MISAAKKIYHNATERFPALGVLRVNRFYFGNIRPLWTNMRYLRYHRFCRRAYVPAETNGMVSRVQETARHFRENGYVLLHPPYDPHLIPGLAARCQELVNRGQFTTIAGVEEWFLNISNSLSNVPELTSLIHPEVEAVIEACFGSHFKIYSSELYRTVPTHTPPEASALWHTDNYPPAVYKIMVYLTPCDKETGALRLHPLPSTRRILRQGFFNRYKASPFQRQLDHDGVTVEGPAGTVLFWNSNMIHRAHAPSKAFRDVAAFKLLPSPEPWQKHLARAREKINYENRTEQVPTDPVQD